MSTIKPLIYDATNNRLAEMEMAMPFGKNLLINAECLINQRGFSGGALGEGVYGYDRFKAGAGGCNFSVSGGVWTHASGPIVQIVEMPTGVYGSNVTFSVEDPTEDISVTVGGVGGTITAGSGRRGVTLAIPAGSGNLTVQWSATGATYSRPQLERGSAVTQFEYRPDALELMLCQRYFIKYEYVGGDAFGQAVIFGSDAITMIYLPTSMQAKPASSVSGTLNLVPGNYVANSAGAIPVSPEIVALIAGGLSGGTSGHGGYIYFTAGQTGVISLDAEF